MKALTEDQYWSLNHFITCGWDVRLSKQELALLKKLVTVVKGKSSDTYNIKPLKIEILAAYYQYEVNYYRHELNTLHSKLNKVLLEH